MAAEDNIKDAVLDDYHQALTEIASKIQAYVKDPRADYKRVRLLSAETVLDSLVVMSAKSSKNELLEIFPQKSDRPTLQGWTARLDQLNSSAFKVLLDNFDDRCHGRLAAARNGAERSSYELRAVDGSTFRYPSDSRFSGEEYLTQNGTSKATWSVHLTGMYDLRTNMYRDGVIQSARDKNEFSAFCEMVDREASAATGRKIINIGDRGFCSYNNMAHVKEAQQYFLFRSKDILNKGILSRFTFPDTDTFDVDVTASLTRSQSKKVKAAHENVRYIGTNVAFDYLESGSLDVYKLSFRVVRVKLDDGKHEALVTNLSRSEFSPAMLKELYRLRWGEETSFRELKYTLGTIQFHSKKPDRVKQELWANMLRYNITQGVLTALAEERTPAHDDENHESRTPEFALSNEDSALANTCEMLPISLDVDIIVQNGRPLRKYPYAINFSTATLETKLYLRGERTFEQVRLDLRDELVPIRDGRSFPRLQTAHFRKPRVFTYRAA